MVNPILDALASTLAAQAKLLNLLHARTSAKQALIHDLRHSVLRNHNCATDLLGLPSSNNEKLQWIVLHPPGCTNEMPSVPVPAAPHSGIVLVVDPAVVCVHLGTFTVALGLGLPFSSAQPLTNVSLSLHPMVDPRCNVRIETRSLIVSRIDPGKWRTVQSHAQSHGLYSSANALRVSCTVHVNETSVPLTHVLQVPFCNQYTDVPLCIEFPHALAVQLPPDSPLPVIQNLLDPGMRIARTGCVFDGIQCDDVPGGAVHAVGQDVAVTVTPAGLVKVTGMEVRSVVAWIHRITAVYPMNCRLLDLNGHSVQSCIKVSASLAGIASMYEEVLTHVIVTLNP